MTLGVGVRTGGDSKTNAALVERLKRMANIAGRVSAEHPSDVGLELVFDVPGPLVSPPYSGVRTGTFWPDKRKLQVQIATPEGFASQAAQEEFLEKSVDEAVKAAARFLKRKNLTFNLPQLESAAKALVRS